MKLTSKQRKYLRSKAHHLKPVVIIGKAEFNQSIIDTVEQCLNSHELIKVKFSQHKDSKEEIDDESDQNHIMNIKFSTDKNKNI